ncbi:hypothetical protein QYM36_008508, partial [Artemia franciscana]
GHCYDAKNEHQRRDTNDNNIDSEVVKNADQKPSLVSTALTSLKGVPLVLYEATTIQLLYSTCLVKKDHILI